MSQNPSQPTDTWIAPGCKTVGTFSPSEYPEVPAPDPPEEIEPGQVWRDGVGDSIVIRATAVNTVYCEFPSCGHCSWMSTEALRKRYPLETRP